MKIFWVGSEVAVNRVWGEPKQLGVLPESVEGFSLLQIVLVEICQHLPNVASNINSLNYCLVNLTQPWVKLNQTLGNNLPNNSSEKCELGKFYATLVKCCPII